MSGFDDPAMFTARCRRCRAWKPWAASRAEIERVGDMHRRAYGHEFTVRERRVVRIDLNHMEPIISDVAPLQFFPFKRHRGSGS